MVFNGALQTRSQIDVLASGNPKSWDLRLAGEVICSSGSPQQYVLDVGTYQCRILELLYARGFQHLYGCDLAPVEWRRRILPYVKRRRLDHLAAALIGLGPIRLSRQDIQRTDYPSEKFAFVTSLSVIEHGIDLLRYYAEMFRVMKSGGLLITSLDYWPEAIDTGHLRPFGLPWKIFTRSDIEEMLCVAYAAGFESTGLIDYSVRERVVSWQGKQYTFLFCVLRRP